MRHFLALAAAVFSLQCIHSPPALSRAAEGHENGNAGDIYAIEFNLSVRDVVQRLRLLPASDLLGVNLDLLSKTILATAVSSEEHVYLNGYEVNAKNLPDERKIVINRSWWRPLRASNETKNRLQLSLHEYLPLIGIDDKNFKVSERLIALLDVKNYDPNRWWSPLNPANYVSMSIDNAPPGCELKSAHFNPGESEELISIETTGASCRDSDYRKVMIHKSSINAPPSTGYRGTVNTYSIAIVDKNAKVLGVTGFRPKIAECLAPEEGTCALGGNVVLGDVSFQFWFLRELGL